MKKLLCLCAALVLIFTTASAFAATDVTGAWDGEFKSSDGSVTLELAVRLKQDGTTLTGDVASTQGGGDPLAITDGKIDGDKISFKITFNGIVISHEGTLIHQDANGIGEEIKLASTSDSTEFPGGEMILKRAKPVAPVPMPPAAPMPPATTPDAPTPPAPAPPAPTPPAPTTAPAS